MLIFVTEMMRSSSKKRVWAIALNAILVLFLVAKTAHVLVEHTHHSDKQVCAHVNAQGTHLHDARYAPDDCQICAFCVSASCLPPNAATFLPPLGAFADMKLEAPIRPFIQTACDTHSLRGPPVL